jgi:hypothetical protein
LNFFKILFHRKKKDLKLSTKGPKNSLKFHHKIIPNFCFKSNKNIQILEKCNKYFKDHLSIEQIFHQFYNTEKLMKLVVDGNNINEFLLDSTHKIPYDKVEEYINRNSGSPEKSSRFDKINLVKELEVNVNQSQSILQLQSAMQK